MSAEGNPVSKRLPRPEGLLLDFGGVVVQTRNLPDWPARLAAHIRAELSAASVLAGPLTQESIEADLRAGSAADSLWKDAMSRPFAPQELTYEEFWDGFVAADWPPAARAFVRDNARTLCQVMGEFKQARETRPGILELLAAADRFAVPVGIVSNTLMGVVHRDYLDVHDLTERFAAQIYSDEVFVRKPNPQMILLGARAIGVPAESCWYVGDNFDRDVLCGVRAGVGGNVLMEARDTYELPYDLGLVPDAVVADPFALLELFQAALEQEAA